MATTMQSHIPAALLQQFELNEEWVGDHDKVLRLTHKGSVVLPGTVLNAKDSLPPQGIVSTGHTLAGFIIPESNYNDEMLGNLDKIKNEEPPIYSANFKFPIDESLNRKTRNMYDTLSNLKDHRMYLFMKIAPRQVLCFGAFEPCHGLTTSQHLIARPDNLSTNACHELDHNTRVAIETVTMRITQLKRKREKEQKDRREKKEEEKQARKVRRAAPAEFFRLPSKELEEGEIDEEEEELPPIAPGIRPGSPAGRPPSRPRSQSGASSSTTKTWPMTGAARRATVRFKIPTLAQTAAKKAAKEEALAAAAKEAAAAAAALMAVAEAESLDDLLFGNDDDDF